MIDVEQRDQQVGIEQRTHARLAVPVSKRRRRNWLAEPDAEGEEARALRLCADIDGFSLHAAVRIARAAF